MTGLQTVVDDDIVEVIKSVVDEFEENDEGTGKAESEEVSLVSEVDKFGIMVEEHGGGGV